MIVVSLAGGLGNQFFQYATGRRLAVKHRTELLLDVSNYGEATPQEKLAGLSRKVHLFDFQIQARAATPIEIAALKDRHSTSRPFDRATRVVRRVYPSFIWPKNHIIEKQYRFQPEAMDFPNNVYLTGFWQSPKYFEDIEPRIRKELDLLDESITNRAHAAIESLRQKHGRVVSVHVRRGDLARAFETLRQPSRVHGPPVPLAYYEQAFAKFDPSCCFFVFSDSANDIDWCKQHINVANVEFSNAQSELWDFAAMRSCDHHIIANSTFSWWAAWLNSRPGRRVIAPRHWSGPQSKTEMATDDLIPPDWTMI